MTKKSETLEIRVSYELKSKLADLSEQRGSTMSAFVRDVIDRELEDPFPDSVGDQIMQRRSFGNLGAKALYVLPVLLLAGLYWGSAQSPAQATPSARVIFSELDHNGDKLISEAELHHFLNQEGIEFAPEDCGLKSQTCTAEAVAANEIQRADADSNGFVEYAEFETFFLAERAAEFLEIDNDENGVVSPDELIAFEVQELVEFPDPEMDEPLSPKCLNMSENGKINGIAKACLTDRELRVFMAEADTNFDGKITLQEFLEN
ncbi:EF hand [Ruegeria halocynthiae]|uniref:EF hand n=1 Tax=Ruegeria halocynthiae TaxID=985054 RepID=A0A1H2TQN8_9RHOB|nr:EF-hand domain-containing protein [Ruegeria halocynthiae]SDW46190.1 EF hand [Ruegeria halocynthiae]